MNATNELPAFDYVHAPGCGCASDDGGSYHERLERARYRILTDVMPEDEEGWCGSRHRNVQLSGTVEQKAALEEAWTIVCERVPDGSCLGWLGGDDAGWPGDHSDHHLLQLYREALRLCGTTAVAWASLREAWKDHPARSARPFAGSDEPFMPCAMDEDGAFEREALVRAWRAAGAAEGAATEALAHALQVAPFGAQPDGSFVTRRSLGGSEGMRFRHVLHAPDKQGPLAEAVDAPQEIASEDGEVWLDVLRRPEDARAMREAERAAARRGKERYEALLVRAALVLVGGGSLPYTYGPELGTVRVDGEHVSARGALRFAGRDAGRGGHGVEGLMRRARISRVEAGNIIRESMVRNGLTPDCMLGRTTDDLVLTLRGIDRWTASIVVGTAGSDPKLPDAWLVGAPPTAARMVREARYIPGSDAEAACRMGVEAERASAEARGGLAPTAEEMASRAGCEPGSMVERAFCVGVDMERSRARQATATVFQELKAAVADLAPRCFSEEIAGLKVDVFPSGELMTSCDNGCVRGVPLMREGLDRLVEALKAGWNVQRGHLTWRVLGKKTS